MISYSVRTSMVTKHLCTLAIYAISMTCMARALERSSALRLGMETALSNIEVIFETAKCRLSSTTPGNTRICAD